MYRIVFVFLSFILTCCAIRPYKKSIEDVPMIFRIPSIQDSLMTFIHSIDSFPKSSIQPEYLVQFRLTETGDTTLVMAANENISPSWDLNSVPDICKHKYRPIGGIKIDKKNILIRTIDDINISNIINLQCLDSLLGRSIDSLVLETDIEPYGIATYKFYRLEKGNLILLQEKYLGQLRLNNEEPDCHW